jgi:uncharacterized protein YkwD
MPDRVRTYCPLNSLAGQVEQVMNRRRTCVAGVFATLLLLVPTGCRVQIVDDAPPTVVPATAIATPFSIPSSTLPLVPSDGPTPSPPPDSRPAPAEPSSSGSSSAEYTVQPGDTLLGIATTHGVPMAAIQLENDMGESILVQAGQVLVIPPPEDWQEASRFWIVHVVKAAETLGGIARTYGLKTAEIKAVNQMTDPDLIVVGQELVIPLGAPVAEQVSSPAVAPTSLPAPTHTPASLIPSPMPTPSLSPAPIASAIPSTPPPPDVASWPRETVRLINIVRTQHELPPLAYNDTLAQAAQAQANDCAQRGWCSHTGSNGSDIKTRILEAGYDPATWAECWAQRQTPQGAVDIWMDEVPPNDPHRRTLLTTWLTEIGVGVARTTWGYYFIADFGRPK